MVDYQTIGVLIAAASVVIGVINSIMSNRRAQETRERELETRQAQLLMQIYSRLDTPEKSKAFIDIFTWESTDFEDFLNKYDPLKKLEEANNMTGLVIYFEGIGTMVKEGFIDIHQVAT